ncbi:TatD family hydrolase, partial [Streptococcus suis]
KRGRENRTGYTRYVVEMLAQLRNQSVEEVAKATYENARSLFRIDSEN